MSQDPHTQAPAPHPIDWLDCARADAFDAWLRQVCALFGLDSSSLRMASADASFRRYFRIDSCKPSKYKVEEAISYIIMDAPPDKENCQPFVKVAALMQSAGLRAPEVLNWQEAQGFMLLTDLGHQTMMQVIDRDTPAANLPLYLQAIETLVAWQCSSKPDVLPVYDDALMRRELELFPDWYLARHKGQTVDAAMRTTLDKAFTQIIATVQQAPRVFVHRDFMPRNLMVSTQPNRLGVLDFQDAVYGPIGYDIASLMCDAFLTWDEEFCLDVTVRYWEKARQAGLPVGNDFGEFYRHVQWMGLQRHLKVAGIFARLTLRDGKAQYLADTPRFIAYIRSTCARYHELKPLLRLIDQVEGVVQPNIFGFGRQ